nr:MAG TPA: hypothetical protein [Caudoviricetes sp.]
MFTSGRGSAQSGEPGVLERQPTGVVDHGSGDASYGHQLWQAACVDLRFALCEGAHAWSTRRKTETRKSIMFHWR